MKDSLKRPPVKHPVAGDSTTLAQAGSGRGARVRRITGLVGGALAAVFIAWLPLGILGFVPFVLEIPGESDLRTHAGAAVACLMVTAWAYWES
jgi:hypothetical protein